MNNVVIDGKLNVAGNTTMAGTLTVAVLLSVGILHFIKRGEDDEISLTCIHAHSHTHKHTCIHFISVWSTTITMHSRTATKTRPS